MTGRLESTVDVVVGRLVEIRLATSFRAAVEVDAFFDALPKVVRAKVPPPAPIVTVADWRSCTVLSDEAAERMLTRMRGNNAEIVRSAVLASHDSPSAVMQFLRLVRGSGTKDRQLFFEEEPLITWLGEVLTATESARLRRFLNERLVAH